ncbi:hypothetical protein P879_05438, partial [Paragonimus westermani]
QTADCLTAPYQSFPNTDSPVYLYTWTLPEPHVLADLSRLDQHCFAQANQAFGLLFSQPISKNDYVCRVPLYLTRGMARARVRYVKTLRLSSDQLDLITAAHHVLGELLTNLADLSHVCLSDADRKLRDALQTPNTTAPTAGLAKHLSIRNRFTELAFDPSASRLLGLITFISLPDFDIDYEATGALVRWSEVRSKWITEGHSAISPDEVQHIHGVLPTYPVRLGQIPVQHWAGVIVRPCHLPDTDPGMFAISGPSSQTGLHQVPAKLAGGVYVALSSNTACSFKLPSSLNSTVTEPVLSYVDYFSICHPPICALLDRLRPELPLASCFRLTRHQNAAQVVAGMRKNDKSNMDRSTALYLADACFVHPLSAWLWFLLSIVPVVLYQTTRALSALQLFRVISDGLLCQTFRTNLSDDHFERTDYTVLLPDRVDAPCCVLSDINHITDMDMLVQECTPAEDRLLDEKARSADATAHCPHPNELLEPTTLLAARDAVNLERLELLGDSLLQLIGTLIVYSSASDKVDEGQLTAMRIQLVSNSNLYNIAARLGWSNYCTGQVYCPPDHFIFPCYTVSQLTNKSDSDSRMFVRLTDKSLADMIEALIGCFLQHLGLPAACRFLAYLGISPNHMNRQSDEPDFYQPAWSPWCQLLSDPIYPNSQPPPPPALQSRDRSRRRPLFCLPHSQSVSSPDLLSAEPPVSGAVADVVDYFRLRLCGLQNILGYQFQNINTLIQALMHQSSPYISLFGSYQRLEFLGDAVLGYVITTCLYKKHIDFNPGKLTETRSNIVSNNSLACAVVEHKIHSYISHSQPAIDTAISYVTFLLDRTSSYSEQLELLTQQVLKGLRVKALADVFESIIGAIFVDSNGNLNIVSDLIQRLLNDRIDDYVERNPINPFRTMHVIYPNLKYNVAQLQSPDETGGKYKLCASLSGEDICTYGATRNQARLALAERLKVPLKAVDQNTF